MLPGQAAGPEEAGGPFRAELRPFSLLSIEEQLLLTWGRAVVLFQIHFPMSSS